MNQIAAGKIAAVIIASFGKRNNRPLLLSLAIFVAENPGCKTTDAAEHFCPARMRRSSRGYVTELSSTRNRLDKLVEVGILIKDYKMMFVPKHSSKTTSHKQGPGRRVKDTAATWSLRKEFDQ